jgi:hypothetical protein
MTNAVSNAGEYRRAPWSVDERTVLRIQCQHHTTHHTVHGALSWDDWWHDFCEPRHFHPNTEDQLGTITDSMGFAPLRAGAGMTQITQK